jgi:hypothetical protein
MTMNKEQPVTMSLAEIDAVLFETLTSEFKTMYPNDHRTALRAAMHVADKVMTQIEPVAARAYKSEMAKKAAAARYAPPPQNPGAEPTPQAFQTPHAPIAAPVKRTRRTKAQKAADDAAIAAAQAMQAGQQAAQAVPMGPAFAPPFQPAPPAAAPMLQPPPAPQQPAPPPAPTNAELTAQAFPAAPPVQDFATLARQAAAQGVPQFAPAPQTPPPTFG